MASTLIDIGGTNVRFAKLSSGSSLIPDKVVRLLSSEIMDSINGPKSLETFGLRCAEIACEEFGADSDRFAIAFPGPISRSGKILAAPTLRAEFGETNTQSFLAPFKQVAKSGKVLLMNDLLAAGYRHVEMGIPDFHIVTISSGIGQKVFSNAKPVLGPDGWGGELGHVMAAHAPLPLPCDCGGGSHIGGISSGRGIQRAFQMRFAKTPDVDQEMMPPDQIQDLLNKSKEANAYLGECLRPLSYGLAVMVMSTGITRIILTGGFTANFSDYFAAILEAQVASFCSALSDHYCPRVTVSDKCDDDVLIGLGSALRLGI